MSLWVWEIIQKQDLRFAIATNVGIVGIRKELLLKRIKGGTDYDRDKD